MIRLCFSLDKGEYNLFNISKNNRIPEVLAKNK